jgi:hypothetical protein
MILSFPALQFAFAPQPCRPAHRCDEDDGNPLIVTLQFGLQLDTCHEAARYRGADIQPCVQRIGSASSDAAASERHAFFSQKVPEDRGQELD